MHSTDATSQGQVRSRADASPPTKRVVALLELLAAQPEHRLTISDLGRLLDMNRSTCAAILSSLEDAAWVERRPDRTFALGTGMLAIAAAVNARHPILRAADIELARLSDQLACPCTLTRATPDELVVIARYGDETALPAGVAVGTRFPLHPPFGATIVALQSREAQRQWIARANLSARDDARWRGLLTSIRARGTGAWRLESSDDALRHAALTLVRAISEQPGQQELRDGLVALLGRLGARGCTDRELDRDEPLPIGYIAAPATDGEGARYEIELHVNNPSMTRTERRRFLDALADAAAAISPEG